MNVLVLQHLATEHPGILREFFRDSGATLTTVELDAGEVVPPLDDFDMMLVMGGPQDLWEQRIHAWMPGELAAIRHFVVDLNKPFLGICLGHQLLATAIGGTVEPSKTPEVGILSVTLTDAGASDPVTGALPNPMTVLQWHGAEVTALPHDAVVLAHSPACSVQAFRYGDKAYGIQFHVEITFDTVSDWAAIPAYAASLERQLGHNAASRLNADVLARIDAFNADARKLYDAFMAAAACANLPASGSTPMR